MFKKSDEQEWTRFRGALAKDRDDSPQAHEPASAPPVAAAPAPQPSAGAATITPTSGGVRPTRADVSVTIPPRSARLSASDSHEIESLIGERTSFEGTFKCEGSLRVLGTVDGELQSAGTIVIEEQARVNAKLTAAQVTVAGRVEGEIHCRGRLEIRSTGRVTGEIHAGALIVQEGAFFDGNSKMESKTETPTPAQPLGRAREAVRS